MFVSNKVSALFLIDLYGHEDRNGNQQTLNGLYLFQLRLEAASASERGPGLINGRVAGVLPSWRRVHIYACNPAAHQQLGRGPLGKDVSCPVL